jgi:NADH:ubiquinone oxidoreductase subunit F (NADH-binding)
MSTGTSNPRSDTLPAASTHPTARLLPPASKRSLDEHLQWFGDLPAAGPGLLGEVERSGLRGKGGARFPTATKLAAVASRRRAVVVANGTEGEPASVKDIVLMSHAPHLVLDGAVLAAEIVGAREVIMCVKRGSPVQPILERAIAERSAEGYDAIQFRVVGAPNRYVSGEETALVSWLNGGDAKPMFVPPRPFERGVDGRPTLVQNVETLGDLALIGRFGSKWYRSAGTPEDPGTTLVTLSGAVTKPGVYEIPLGSRLGDVLRMAGANSADLSGVLVGGYFGAWMDPAAAADVRLSVEALKRTGGGLGAGILVAMPRSGICVLAEVARATRWLADQNAGQCGACVNGLDAIAGAMETLVAGDRDRRAEALLKRWLSMMEGRGACKHPDGVARFVASSLRVFHEEIARHRQLGPCRAGGAEVLPTPRTGGWR